MVKVINTKDELDTELKENANKLVVVDFTASWCGPCRMMAPTFAKLADEFPDVVFLKVDVDDAPEIAAEYQVSCMPTFVFLKNGSELSRIEGANEERLRQDVEKYK